MSQHIIAHVDMDSYFASVEQQANPFLRNKPIAVSGKRTKRSVVAAASIEAKKNGVKTAMPTWKAKKICPELIIVPGDSKRYSDITRRFNNVFKTFSDTVERFSIDESFLDLTDHVSGFMEGGLRMMELQQEIRKTCGPHVTCSIGVGPNKLIAKLASDYDKPSGLTVVCPKDKINFIDTVSLVDICGIGPQTKKRLSGLGIHTTEQLRNYPVPGLVDAFNSYGYFLHAAANGEGEVRLNTTTDAPKSVGHSYTLPKNISDPNNIWPYLLGLAEKVAWRLRLAEYQAGCVHARIRYGDFTSKRTQTRFQEPTNNGHTIANIAWNMMKTWVSPKHPVRLIGVSASQLTPATGQKPLLDKDKNLRALTQAVDNVQKRYGYGTVQRARTIKTTFQKRSTGF